MEAGLSAAGIPGLSDGSRFGASRRRPTAVGEPEVSRSVDNTDFSVIDPLQGLTDGTYRDDLVTVLHRDAPTPISDVKVVRTKHFELWRHGWQLVLRHRLPDNKIDDSLTDLINDELFRPGWVSGSAVFESIFTGVVLTCRPDPLDAWELFYRNTLRHYHRDRSTPDDTPESATGLSTFIALHQHADQLVPTTASVLEIGSCFGFLSLYLARRPTRKIQACDISKGTIRLLDAVAERLKTDVATFVADAARIPLPDRSVDVVLLIHLLEHLEPRHGQRAIDEALRVADQRVIIAVPYEDQATIAYGHLRTLDESDLSAWGAQATGWDCTVYEKDGGWLILDRR